MKLASLPLKSPSTIKLVSVPTLVILGCAAVVTVPAVVADVADVADEAFPDKLATVNVLVLFEICFHTLSIYSITFDDAFSVGPGRK